MIVVTGATGNVGGAVLRQLLDSGESVRAVTRKPDRANLPAGAEIVGGDLDQPESLADAFDGADRLFLFPNPTTAAEVTTLAKRHGVHRVVVLSSNSVTEAHSDNVIAVMHRSVEDTVRASGLDWTFVRPGGFATNTLAWAPGIRAEGLVRAPFADLGNSLIHEADIAAVAVAALLEDGHSQASYELSGPEALTPAQQTQAIGTAIGRELRFEEQSIPDARAQMLEQIPAPIVDAILGYADRAMGVEVLPTVEQITGHPARTFAQWARDHAADFR